GTLKKALSRRLATARARSRKVVSPVTRNPSMRARRAADWLSSCAGPLAAGAAPFAIVALSATLPSLFVRTSRTEDAFFAQTSRTVLLKVTLGARGRLRGGLLRIPFASAAGSGSAAPYWVMAPLSERSVWRRATIAWARDVVVTVLPRATVPPLIVAESTRTP